MLHGKDPHGPVVGTPRRVIAGFVLAMVTLLGVGGVTLLGFHERTQMVSASMHTVAVLRAIEHLESHLNASQLALAEFLVTGEKQWLAPYERSQQTIPEALRGLRTLLTLGPDSEQRYAELERLIIGALQRDAREIEGQRANVAIDDLRPLLLENKFRLDRAAALLDELNDGAAQHLDEKQRSIATSIREATLVVVVGDSLLLVLILMAAVLSTQDASAKARAVYFQRRILSIVGHDLRNPLSVVSMAAAQIGRETAEGDRRQTWVARISSASSRMDRMIRDLLDHSRLELGMSLPMEVRPADADVSCLRVVEDVRAIHPRREIVYARGERADVTWDADRIEQVLENLVTNAIKYSPETAPVHVEWIRTDNQIVIQVKNRGEPIPDELLPQIFEPFQRGTHMLSKQSVGLGLYIVRHIVMKHGGTIAVQSSKSAGTTFTVVLPQALPRHVTRVVDSRPPSQDVPS